MHTVDVLKVSFPRIKKAIPSTNKGSFRLEHHDGSRVYMHLLWCKITHTLFSIQPLPTWYYMIMNIRYTNPTHIYSTSTLFLKNDQKMDLTLKNLFVYNDYKQICNKLKFENL